MLSSKFAMRLSLEPQTSRQLTCALIAVHVLGITVLLSPLSVSFGLRIGLLGLMLWSLSDGLRRVRLRDPAAIVRLDWSNEGRWRLFTRAGGVLEGHLLADSLVLPVLIVLRFSCPRARDRAVVLAADSLPETLLRHLRVRLCLEGVGRTSAHK